MKLFEMRSHHLTGYLFMLTLGFGLMVACEKSPPPSIPATSGGTSTTAAPNASTSTAEPALTQEQIQKKVAELIEQLNGEEMGKRIEAADALAAYGPAAKHAVPSLIKALSADDPLLQRDASLALGSIGEPAMGALIESASDDSPVVRASIAYVLGQVGAAAKDGVPVLIQMLKDEDTSVRQSAAGALGMIGPAAKAAIPALEKASEDEFLAAIAKRSLKQIKAEK